jgi:predicted SnoaL-like aldol condensation-catalyzing enzyme
MLMSTEENKALFRRANEAINSRDLTVLDKFMAANYIDHTNQLKGREGVKQLYHTIFKALPDFHRTIEDIAAEGDKVWIRFKITGTLPNGQKTEAETVSILRLVKGKAVEGWSSPKVAGDLQKQLLGK